jgi:uncharacterized protein (DUF58 family)
MNKLYLSPLFYTIFFICIGLMAISFFVPVLYYIMLVSIVLFCIVTIYDFVYLSSASKKIHGTRTLDKKLSLGDYQEVKYLIHNNNDFSINAELIDEFPLQLQQRNAIKKTILDKNSESQHLFNIKPTERGEYYFENFYLLLSSKRLGLAIYKLQIDGAKMVKVYPSVLQMKKYAIQIFSQTASSYGIRQVRMVGENDEFEHIRNYTQGDNIKSINWKATSRKGELLVNQFEDSKSQSIYCLIDKGRCMEMPFEGLSLLEYSINACLVISNIILQKYDKAGLMTFSNTIGNMLKADNKRIQLEAIYETLYNESTNFKESNFQSLYYTVRQKLNRRSIIFLFTNFELLQEAEANSAYIKGLAQKHIVVIISFLNTELLEMTAQECALKSDVYDKYIAKSLYNEKFKIMNLLTSYGAQVIMTTPQNLSINVINKYLEIKAKRLK